MSKHKCDVGFVLKDLLLVIAFDSKNIKIKIVIYAVSTIYFVVKSSL